MRKAVTVSLPEPLTEELDAVSREAGTSRSEIVREGTCRLADLDAYEVEVSMEVASPRADLIQWQLIAMHKGFAYCLFCTTTQERWPEDKPRFEEFLSGWQLGGI